MELKEIIKRNRSYRRFYQNQKISKETLLSFVELARLSPSARNAQILKYYISNESELNERIFKHLTWAGYLKDWDGPAESEKPSAYIIITHDKSIAGNQFCDEGIAAQSIMLGASEIGLGGCIIAAIDRKNLRNELSLDDNLEILLVLAIGKPNEKVILESMEIDDEFRYWRDKSGIHHVPKRKLSDIVINF